MVGGGRWGGLELDEWSSKSRFGTWLQPPMTSPSAEREYISCDSRVYIVVCDSSIRLSVPNWRRRQYTLVSFYARIDSEAKIDIPEDGFRDNVLNINTSRRWTMNKYLLLFPMRKNLYTCTAVLVLDVLVYSIPQQLYGMDTIYNHTGAAKRESEEDNNNNIIYYHSCFQDYMAEEVDNIFQD